MAKDNQVPTIEEQAQSFAQRAVNRLKAGSAKKADQPNMGEEFSRERDAKAVESHKHLLETPLWAEFIAEAQVYAL